MNKWLRYVFDPHPRVHKDPEGYQEQVEYFRRQNEELQQETIRLKKVAKEAKKNLYRLKARMRNHPSHKVRSCDRKVRYEVYEEAQCQLQLDGNVGRMFIYPCQYCQGYHLTKKVQENVK